MTLANVEWRVNGEAVKGLQRNPLIIYPGYPALELEAGSPLAFMAFFKDSFLANKSFPPNGFTGTPSNPALCVCVSTCMRAYVRV